ncbi:HIT family protein [Priestia koreensis]|uniref:HIT family hydrolase n=1 Tax=Priestia koreensis TaxID=284581 RepID=A0A0M0KZS3_9BACI|nr:HIT family protein [Priestia koreensis]KOO44309.1 HIT family hydrolase [Priestia koreensis]
MPCLGCQLASKELPVYVVFEDEHVCCILDHDPFNEGHVMILPKQHIHDVDELNDQTSLAIMKASRLLSKALKRLFNPDGITFAQNGGIFNELSHYHMHAVPRYKEQSFADFYGDETVVIEQESALKTTQHAMQQVIHELTMDHTI